ncbi:MAG: class IIb bacteriocin, lactobin A/cerein 7B family [Streptococcaceae bacterium]|jgi:lactobin A/cerein 7B family class IIb bacteriocin|nr:class IIb bacteriocin, lactobin A/cerein 7B family [Streptococcaceae bacterium]
MMNNLEKKHTTIDNEDLAEIDGGFGIVGGILIVGGVIVSGFVAGAVSGYYANKK